MSVSSSNNYQHISQLFQQAVMLLDTLLQCEEGEDTIYDHDDWKQVSSYIRGTSYHPKLKSNSWHYLKQHSAHFMDSFVSTSSSSLLDIISRLNNSSTTSCMIFGDGDFSFSRSLITTWKKKMSTSSECDGQSLNLFSTVYDSYDTVMKTYDYAAGNIQYLKESGLATAAFSVDATTFRNKDTVGKYNIAIFNFPYADVDKGRYSSAASASSSTSSAITAMQKFDTMYVYKGRHIELIEQFFAVCSIQRSHIVVLTLLLSQAVVWQIEHLAFNSGYMLTDCVPIGMAYHDIFLNGYKKRRSYVDTSFPAGTSVSDSSSSSSDDELEAWCFVFHKVDAN